MEWKRKGWKSGRKNSKIFHPKNSIIEINHENSTQRIQPKEFNPKNSLSPKESSLKKFTSKSNLSKKFQPTHHGAEPKDHEHEEKEKVPEGRHWHETQSLRVHHEDQTRTISCHVCNLHPFHGGHVAEDAEDHEACVDAGQYIANGDEKRVSGVGGWCFILAVGC